MRYRAPKRSRALEMILPRTSCDVLAQPSLVDLERGETLRGRRGEQGRLLRPAHAPQHEPRQHPRPDRGLGSESWQQTFHGLVSPALSYDKQ